MGKSYEGLLAASGLDEVRQALAATGEHGLLASVAANLTVLAPTDEYSGVVDIEPMAEDLSRACACRVLAHSVYDSDVLMLTVYRNGERIHRYVSEAGALGEVFEDGDGLMKIEFEGVVYLESDPARPQGPRGVDARAFLPFAADETDPDAVTRILAGDGYAVKAEILHDAFLKALHLDSPLLRDCARHLDPQTVGQTVRV